MNEEPKRKPGRPRMEKINTVPNVQTELEKAAEQFDLFDAGVKKLTLDKMNEAPMEDKEEKTEVLHKQAERKDITYLKPLKRVGSNQKINERFRKEIEYSKELVEFIAENKESPGSPIEIWTRKFGGEDCLYWIVPVGKPICAPRALAEALKECNYHILSMDQATITTTDMMGTYHGAMVAEKTVSRIDAVPYTKSKHIFMGARQPAVKLESEFASSR